MENKKQVIYEWSTTERSDGEKRDDMIGGKGGAGIGGYVQ